MVINHDITIFNFFYDYYFANVSFWIFKSCGGSNGLVYTVKSAASLHLTGSSMWLKRV